MRGIQFFNSSGYYACLDEDAHTEDGYCLGAGKGLGARD